MPLNELKALTCCCSRSISPKKINAYSSQTSLTRALAVRQRQRPRHNRAVQSSTTATAVDASTTDQKQDKQSPATLAPTKPAPAIAPIRPAPEMSPQIPETRIEEPAGCKGWLKKRPIKGYGKSKRRSYLSANVLSPLDDHHSKLKCKAIYSLHTSALRPDFLFSTAQS